MTIFTKNKAITGSVTVNPKSSNFQLNGVSTNFLSDASNLDLVIINNDVPSRKQVKEIINVNTNMILTLESNTKIYGDGYINIANGSNVIVVTKNTAVMNLIANDTIIYEYLNNNVESKIISGSGFTYTLNTDSSFFTASATLTNYIIYPYIDNVSYEIIRTYQN